MPSLSPAIVSFIAPFGILFSCLVCDNWFTLIHFFHEIFDLYNFDILNACADRP